MVAKKSSGFDDPGVGSAQPILPRIAPAAVRYIKLGASGMWEQDCLAKGIVRFGFDTGDPATLQMCLDGRWDELRESWMQSKSPGTATRFTNEARCFFEDPGTTLWVTFIADRLQWGFLEPGAPQAYAGDPDSSWRRVRGGWCCTDIFGDELAKNRLSGAITKLSGYRGTSCTIDVEDKLVARINHEIVPEIEAAIHQVNALRDALVPLIRSLGPRDFEILVDLIFAASGWRRVGSVGKTQPVLDIDLVLPSTKERAFVQVKSRTNQKEFEAYLSLKKDFATYDKMFFVYHTGSATAKEKDVVTIDAKGVSQMAINAGLSDWIIEKAT